MMANVIQFPERSDPHTCGDMICEVCDHRYIGVAPCGRKHFECPKCHRMSAVRAGPVLPEDGVMRQTCATCKGQTFAVMRDALMCSDCGTVLKEDWSGAA